MPLPPIPLPMSKEVKKARAERLIGIIRGKAFRLLAEQRGEYDPIALTIDAQERLGIVALYDGNEFPRRDEALIGLQGELRILAGQNKFEAAATAHDIRIKMPEGAEDINAVCVQYEARGESPLKIYFPYSIKRKLMGNSEVDPGEAITQRGSNIIFVGEGRESD
jgi:hypothetical protein